MKMRGQVTADTVVAVPSNVVWDVYRGLELGRLVDQLLPDVIGKVQVVEGEGGVGTIVKLTFPPGNPGGGVGYLKERFIKIDDEKRIKETEIIEGGYKALGFDAYRVRLEIIEKDDQSSIIRSTLEFEHDEKLADIASQINTKSLEIMAEAIGKYLGEKKD